MYIYLDESYNLKDRDKKQFISINGFMAADVKGLFKKWKECRQPYLKKKRRIHANDSYFSDLKRRAAKLAVSGDFAVVSVFQVVQEISSDHNRVFVKDSLDFDQLYYLLLIELFKIMHLDEYRSVVITVDNRKYRHGQLGKDKFRKDIINFLKENYQQTDFKFVIQPSTTNILLELADFYSNIFYDAYIKDDNSVLWDCRPRIYQLKNPLSNITDVIG